MLASGRTSLPALSGAVSQKILAAAKVVADPRSCLPRKDQPQAQSPRPRPYRRRDFASTGSGEALFKSLSQSQTDCAKYSKHYVRLSFLACYGTTRRGLCFGEQASTENRYVCWSTDSRSIAGLSVRFDLLRRKSGWRGIGRRTSLEQQPLDPPVGMVHSVYMDAESSCPTPTHITEEQISFLADLAGLQFPERDLRSVASALSAHLALGDVLLREDLANVLPTSDPRWHD